MNLQKSYDFIQPDKVKQTIHIIGLGTIGSHIAAYLARCGFTKFALWDLDKVEEKNINNQHYTLADVGKTKVDACRDLILSINPEAEKHITLHDKGWNGEVLSGYVFLAVDSIAIRRNFVEKHMNNKFVKAVFDCRTGLTNGEFYGTDWSSMEARQQLLKTMQFTDEQAAKSTPVSACGGVLGVVTTAVMLSACVVNDFINFVKSDPTVFYGHVEAFGFDITAA